MRMEFKVFERQFSFGMVANARWKCFENRFSIFTSYICHAKKFQSQISLFVYFSHKVRSFGRTDERTLNIENSSVSRFGETMRKIRRVNRPMFIRISLPRAFQRPRYDESWLNCRNYANLAERLGVTVITDHRNKYARGQCKHPGTVSPSGEANAIFSRVIRTCECQLCATAIDQWPYKPRNSLDHRKFVTHFTVVR